MDLEVIEIVTYICAILGGILLLLCIILAAFFIYGFCKKHFGCDPLLFESNNRYVIVPSENNAENGQIILRKYSSEDLPQQTIVPSNCTLNIDHENEYSTSQKKLPPIKKKMQWKQKKKKSFQKSSVDGDADNAEDSELKFSQEELDVPKERLFKSKKSGKLKKRRRSKSDWDIHDVQEADEFNQLMTAGQDEKNNDHRSSQYFDALETIEEDVEMEETESNSNDQEDLLDELDEAATLADPEKLWEDISSTSGSETYENRFESGLQEDKSKQQQMSGRKRRKRKYPPNVQQRINALKVLQLKQKQIEAQFFVDLFVLEAFENIRAKEPLLDKRRRVISSDNEEIEGFWLQAMDNCENLSPIVQIHDRPILKHLVDIKVITSPLELGPKVKITTENLGFRIEFHFTKNDYFKNDILFKDYALRCEPDMADPWSFEGPEVSNCTGCKIRWSKGRNATLRRVKKLKDGEIVAKWAKRNSFFNFFTPPKMTRDSMLDPSKRSLFEAHFQIGLYLKETFVPNAILFYANAHKDSTNRNKRKISKGSMDSMDKDNDGNKTPKPATVQHVTTSPLKHPIAKPNFGKMTKNTTTLDHQGGASKDYSSQNGGHRPPKSNNNNNNNNSSLSQQTNIADEEDSKSAIIEVLPPPAADPINGRYRLLKTENFDEFMKVLGVGLVKRKLANSVSPVNVIMVNDDGSYTVRTETTVRTTELNFRLGEPFSETTLDGRITDTTATRVGNVLTLNQKGDPAKNEMDSQQIRDFNGDKMLMSLVAGGVTCLRYYEKIKE